MIDLETEVKAVLSYRYCKGDKAPIQSAYAPGNSRLLVITGDNASGKSFVARILSARVANEHKMETMRIGMELRSESGFHKAFIFGDESWESTGMISIKSVEGGIRTCKARTIPHVILFDEPDVGLSEGYQAAMGQLLAEFATDMPAHTQYCAIVTHSRRLVKQLTRCNPHFLRIGDTKTLAEFLEEPRDNTVEELFKLKEAAHARFGAISGLMEEAKCDRANKKHA